MTSVADRWHTLLTSRYVCERCLTRFYQPYFFCPACHCMGRVRPLLDALHMLARSDVELRQLIAGGQVFVGDEGVGRGECSI